jgi:hypothetical protein
MGGLHGYATGHVSVTQRHQAISLVLLLNRSPWLDDLSWLLSDHMSRRAAPSHWRETS